MFLGTRVLVMSPRPGRIVLDEATPYGRAAELPDNPRSTPGFIDFRDPCRRRDPRLRLTRRRPRDHVL